ncbi:MAG: TetR/AcrR family transcriptional regulator [Myxococcales bacterium]
MARRKRLELPERREQLLNLAVAAFSSKSYDEVSIDDLAQSAGVSKGLLYHYFPSKRELYVATVRAAADQLIERVLPDPSLSLRDQITRGLDGYLSFVEQNAAAYTSLIQSGIGHDDEVLNIMDSTRMRFVGIMLERGGQTMLNPAQQTLLRGWVGMVEAASLDWIKRRSMTREELSKFLLKSLFYTLQLGIPKRTE